MTELKKLLEDQVINLKLLRQKFVQNSEIEKYEEYNKDFIKLISETIDYISLHLNRVKKNCEENYDGKLILTKDELKRQNQELEQKIIEKTKKLKKFEEKYRLITENVNDIISVCVFL